MVKFSTDESLGKTVDKVTCWCFGVEPIADMWQLRFAGGGNKFSQLCAFKFHSSLPNRQYPDFSIGFVAKLRSHIYHRADKNPSQWYIFKKISGSQTDILGKKELLVNYGFDIDQFFKSDVFKAMLAKFKAAIKHGLDVEVPKFIKTLKSTTDISNAERFAKAIADGYQLLDTTNVNDKFYSLYNYDIHEEDGETDELDEKISQELKRKGVYASIPDDGEPMPEVSLADSDEDEDEVKEAYHSRFDGMQRDIDEFNPAPEPSAWERDPDYKHIDASNMSRISVAVDSDPESKTFGKALFVNRPKKLYSFRSIANVHDDDSFLPVSRKTREELLDFIDGEAAKFKSFDSSSRPELSACLMKIMTAEEYFKKVQYKKGDMLKANLASIKEDELGEGSTEKAKEFFEDSDDVNEDEINESRFDCIVKPVEDGKFAVYEKDGNIWVATFATEDSAEKFAKEYPKMKEDYIKKAAAIEAEKADEEKKLAEASAKELQFFKQVSSRYGNEVFKQMRKSPDFDGRDLDQSMSWAMFGCAQWLIDNSNNIHFQELGKKISEIGASFML